MKVKPIKSYKKPEYPNISEFSRDRSTISAPKRWLKQSTIIALLVSQGFNSACNSVPEPNSGRYAIMANKAETNMDGASSKAPVFIAPIFEHGSGVGSYGCMVISPPIYISEADAKNIIYNELAANGIYLRWDSSPNHDIDIITTKRESKYDEKKNNYEVNYVNFTKKLEIDLYSKILNLAVVYVSRDNYLNFADAVCNRDDETSMGESEDYCGLAYKIRYYFTKDSSMNAVVFYDPIPSMRFKKVLSEKNNDMYIEEGTMQAGADSLRAQVRDYVKWLKKL